MNTLLPSVAVGGSGAVFLCFHTHICVCMWISNDDLCMQASVCVCVCVSFKNITFCTFLCMLSKFSVIIFLRVMTVMQIGCMGFLLPRLPHCMGCNTCTSLTPYVCHQRHLWYHCCWWSAADGWELLPRQHCSHLGGSCCFYLFHQHRWWFSCHTANVGHVQAPRLVAERMPTEWTQKKQIVKYQTSFICVICWLLGEKKEIQKLVNLRCQRTRYSQFNFYFTNVQIYRYLLDKKCEYS